MFIHLTRIIIRGNMSSKEGGYMKKRVIIIVGIVILLLLVGFVFILNLNRNNKTEPNKIITEDKVNTNESDIIEDNSEQIEESSEEENNQDDNNDSNTKKDNNNKTNNTVEQTTTTKESETQNNNSSQSSSNSNTNTTVVEEQPTENTTTESKNDNVGYYDYITGGVKEFNTQSECLAKGEEINTRESMKILEYNSEHMDNQKSTDITNYSCYPSGGGYFLDISCNSGNCNLKYK